MNRLTDLQRKRFCRYAEVFRSDAKIVHEINAILPGIFDNKNIDVKALDCPSYNEENKILAYTKVKVYRAIQ